MHGSVSFQSGTGPNLHNAALKAENETWVSKKILWKDDNESLFDDSPVPRE